MTLFILWFVKNEYNTCSEPTPAKSSCLNTITSMLNEKYSQTLLSECSSDIFGQSGKLRGFKQVDASRRGDIAESSGGCHAGSAWGLRNDLSSVVHTGLRVLSEVQLLAVDLFKISISPCYLKCLPWPLDFSPCLRALPFLCPTCPVFNLWPILMRSISE